MSAKPFHRITTSIVFYIIMASSVSMFPTELIKAAADQLAVVGIKGNSISVYDDDLNFKEERQTKAFLHGRNLAQTPIPVLQRNDKGFVQINDGDSTFWADVTDLILNQGNSSTIDCVHVVRAKAPDNATAAAMGVIACK